MATIVVLAITTAFLAAPFAEASTPVFAFNGSKREPPWVVVNDGVMGGVSSSSVTVAKGALRFAGRVRLENNGGFASTRSSGVGAATNKALASGTSLLLRARGSGTTFAITLQTASGWYWAEIAPPRNEWTDIDLSYARFLPRTRFGEPIAGDSYSGQTVSAIGILISNKRAENFALEIDSISVG